LLARPVREHRPDAGDWDWLRLARLARTLSWLTLGWLGIEAGVAIGAALIAGSAALLGFGLDSGIEAMASLIVIWRFTGTRLASPRSERCAQRLVAVSFVLLAPYIAVEAIRALVAGDRAETSIAGLVLTAGTAIFEPAVGLAKRRIDARLGSAATAGEGTQNLLCAYLAIAVFAGPAANALLGAWWPDGVVALGIAGWAVVEGRRAWAGRSCGCACQLRVPSRQSRSPGGSPRGRWPRHRDPHPADAYPAPAARAACQGGLAGGRRSGGSPPAGHRLPAAGHCGMRCHQPTVAHSPSRLSG
jgi:hypothetical protein